MFVMLEEGIQQVWDNKNVCKSLVVELQAINPPQIITVIAVYGLKIDLCHFVVLKFGYSFF